MTELKENCVRFWSGLKSEFLDDLEKKRVFFITFFVGLVVHFQLYSLMLSGPDTIINSLYHKAFGEIALGRFSLFSTQLIKGNVVSPLFATIFSLIFLGLAVVLIIDILKIKNKYFKYIIALVIAVCPNISSTFTFFYCSDAYILAFLLACLSVYLVREFDKSKLIVVLSGFFIAVSMGFYQTYLSVTMVLCLATLFIDCLDKKNFKDICISVIRYILMGIARYCFLLFAFAFVSIFDSYAYE